MSNHAKENIAAKLSAAQAMRAALRVANNAVSTANSSRSSSADSWSAITKIANVIYATDDARRRAVLSEASTIRYNAGKAADNAQHYCNLCKEAVRFGDADPNDPYPYAQKAADHAEAALAAAITATVEAKANAALLRRHINLLGRSE